MTFRQVIVQAGLATTALVLAYLVWQRAPALAPDEAIVIDLAKHDLAAARFEDPEKGAFVELTPTTDAQGGFITVRLSPQDKAGAGKAPDQAPSKTPERLVRGNDAADKLFASFTPLRASRSLGVLGKDKRKELGLDTSKKRITLTLRNGQRSFTIAPAPPGGTLPYLLDEANGRVYVVARSFLSDFQTAASLLVERRPHAFRLEEADRVQITVGNVRKDFVVSRSEEQVRLSPAGKPTEPDAALKSWHDRAFGLWAAEVLGKDEAPAEGTPQLAFRFDYTARGRQLGFMEIAKVPALATSATAGKDAKDAKDVKDVKDTLYARNERSLGWVRLGADAQNLLAELPAGLR